MPKHLVSLLCAAALLAGAGSAVASGPPATATLPPIVFSDVNPCTGATQVVTIVWTVRFHDFELADPAMHHGVSKLEGSVTTSDGFAGRLTGIALDQGTGPFEEPEGRGTVTNVSHGILRNDSGAAFSVHTLLHVTIVDGEPRVVVERFRLECIG
jgi:hypothetical protein